LGRRIWRKLTRAPFSDRAFRRYNEGVLRACTGKQPDFVWFEWPLLLAGESLLRIRERWPETMMVCYQNDNPFGDWVRERPRWRRFIENIPLFDVHFVWRPSDLTELRQRGAKCALLLIDGVYEPFFTPIHGRWRSAVL